MLTFCLALPLCVAARIYQIIFTIDGVTAFFNIGDENIGNILTIAIALVTALIYFIAFKVYKTPKNPPQHNFALTIMSIALAVVLGNEFLHKEFLPTTQMWQMTMVKILTVLCIAYFLALSLQTIFNFKILPILHIIPVLFAVVQTIAYFISISPLAIISDNILLIAAYCFLMVFFINYAKLYNGIDVEYNFKKILAAGLGTAIVCITQSAAYIIANFISEKGYPHSDFNTMITIFCFGIFALVFTISHFRKTA